MDSSALTTFWALTFLFIPTTAASPPPLPSLEGRIDGIVAVGFDHGADFAHQLHIAFSATVSHSCLFAAQPFHCAASHFAQDSVEPWTPWTRVPNCDGCIEGTRMPFDHCKKTPHVVDVGSLVDFPRRHCGQNPISIPECFDAVEHLQRGARVFAFRGSKDDVYKAGAVENTVALLAQMLPDPANSIKLVTDLPFGHVLPVNATPFDGQTAAAGYDGPKECLQHVFSGTALAASDGAAQNTSWLQFDQTELTEAGVGFQATGWLYLPDKCRQAGDEGCRMVVLADKCDPASTPVADSVQQFARYAEGTGMVVLHPCVGGTVDSSKFKYSKDVASGKLDVFGQLSADYTQQSAPHMRGVGNMIKRLLGKGIVPPSSARPSVAAAAAEERALGAGAACAAGSPALCGCSELIAKRIIGSFDDCTQEAAIKACESRACRHDDSSRTSTSTSAVEGHIVPIKLPTLHINKTSVFAAGCSNTADFSHQLHVAFSSIVTGSCIFSGQPYRCAVTRFENDYLVPKFRSTGAGMSCVGCPQNTTLIYDHCKNHPDWVEVDTLAAVAEAAENVDDPKVHLAGARVFAFGPTHDRCYQPPAMENVANFHLRYATNKEQIKLVQNQPFPHTLPTNSTPYFNQSDPAGYDGPGECLRHVLGDDQLRAAEPISPLNQDYWVPFDQLEFGSTFEGYGMSPFGWLFTPPVCKNETCSLLVLPSGCAAPFSSPFNGTGGSDDAFARYAVENRIVILKTCAGAPINVFKWRDNHENLRGMVDVYGQLGNDYATQKGGQTGPIGSMIKRLLGVTE